MEDKTYIYYIASSWWPGNTIIQDISSNGVNLVTPEYYGVITWGPFIGNDWLELCHDLVIESSVLRVVQLLDHPNFNSGLFEPVLKFREQWLHPTVLQGCT